MAKKVAPVPKGYRTVTPQLVVRGAQAAITFYADVFGATLAKAVYGDDGVTVLHGELKIGNALLRICDEMPAFGVLSPATLGGSATSQHIYAADSDAMWDRALAAGAVVLVPYADTYWGERFGRFVDPFGHLWSVARRVEAVSPAEMARRAQGPLGAPADALVDGIPAGAAEVVDFVDTTAPLENVA